MTATFQTKLAKIDAGIAALASGGMNQAGKLQALLREKTRILMQGVQ